MNIWIYLPFKPCVYHPAGCTGAAMTPSILQCMWGIVAKFLEDLVNMTWHLIFWQLLSRNSGSKCPSALLSPPDHFAFIASLSLSTFLSLLLHLLLSSSFSIFSAILSCECVTFYVRNTADLFVSLWLIHGLSLLSCFSFRVRCFVSGPLTRAASDTASSQLTCKLANS